jgi:hypothetical protein
MDNKGKGANFRLQVPLDASGVEGFKPDQPVKVVAQYAEGKTAEETVKLDAKGKGTATFTFDQDPGAVHLVVGPGDASIEEMLGMQTIGFDLPAVQWQGRKELAIPPITISPFYWDWWRRWCRTFTIHGRLLCPDGSPVPGALVCAYDIDMWWWWSSKQQVGCDTTDAFGNFTIQFRWCCGWWPWWWWLNRVWRLEPILAERIMPVIRRELKLRKLPLPSPKPDLSIFEELLTDGPVIQSPRTSGLTGANTAMRALADVRGEDLEKVVPSINPGALESLQKRLQERLPVIPELERLRLWPWWPWAPWWDCTPDIIFRAIQNCTGEEKVIVDESVFSTRWDIPTTLNVSLVANSEACCIHNPPPPRGNCVIVTAACDIPVNNIGGNPGAPPAPEGFVNPGLVAALGDRPFAGVVPISGLFGGTANVDYYEFEWATAPAGPWNAMPPLAAGNFPRQFWGPALPAGPVGFHYAPFTFTPISGRNVIESREHFEANNGAGTWGLTRWWTYNRDALMVWLTENNFADGTYYLHVRGWTRPGYTGPLTNSRILPLCDTEEAELLVLTLDNRVAPGPASGHPLGPVHPCGSGTVHTCTTEPDTDFLQVRINGNPAEACANVDATGGGTLDIDFLAHDPDGHLAYYTLQATYGDNLVVDLLAAPGVVLTPGSPAGMVPAAAQVGPTYADALTLPQTATSPIWVGGTINLHIPDLRNVFRETCCYQLELRAYKRTIVSCNGDVTSSSAYSNLSEYSLTVVV